MISFEWRPLSYREHFAASNLKGRDLTISVYDLGQSCDPEIDLDGITAAMTSILTAVGDAMREARSDKTRVTLAEQAIGWVKPLVTHAGSVINGPSDEADVDTIMTQ